MSAPARWSPATLATAAALVALPLWQLATIDFDRTAVLTFLPALWLGRDALAAAWQRLPLRSWLALWIAGALVLSLALSPHPAPATTMAANWLLLGTVGLLVNGLVARDPADGRRLLGALAGGALVGCVVVMGGWSLAGGGLLPLYAHHRIFGLHLIGGAVASAALLATVSPARRGRVAWLAVGGVVWAGLLWSGGRAPVLAVLAALGGWIAVASSALRRQLLLAVALLLPLGLVLSALLWTDQPELGWWHAWNRGGAATAPGETAVARFTSTRSEFWSAALGHAREHPWIGRGPDSYRYLTPKLDGQQPHNFLVQLLLDLGIAGALPVLLALGGLAWRGSRQALGARGENGGAPWLAVAAASTLAGLLDGVFYHVLPLTSLVVGLSLAATPTTVTTVTRRRWGLALSAAAIVVLVVHAAEFRLQFIEAPPDTPRDWRARLVRTWPSTTLGLPRWLDRWRTENPEATLAWATWAQDHSPSANYFHLYAAQLLLEKGDRPAAEREFRAALAKAHWSLQPDLRALLRAHGFTETPDPH
jgi:O-antigen ligase